MGSTLTKIFRSTRQLNELEPLVVGVITVLLIQWYTVGREIREHVVLQHLPTRGGKPKEGAQGGRVLAHESTFDRISTFLNISKTRRQRVRGLLRCRVQGDHVGCTWLALRPH